MKHIDKKTLQSLYIKKRFSCRQIATYLSCSEGKISYWLKKHQIPKRTISEAIYSRNNPNGDPFSFTKLANKEAYFLFGLGLGLYWGEGTKTNRHAVRLGNTDPRLIKIFIKFLKDIYNIDETKLRFGLQIFSDMDENKAMMFWKKYLGVQKNQFYKTVVTPYRGVGSYKHKTRHGVLTVYFGNVKLRDAICNEIKNM